MSISLIQRILSEENLDGWLLYDFHGINPTFYKIVGMPEERHITRRVYYWIPKIGEPLKIVHKIEKHVFDGIPGQLICYARREELADLLSKLSGRVAMEYSIDIPYLSFVDGGTIDSLRALKNIEIVSSGALLQKLLSTLDKVAIESHLAAAMFLDKLVSEASTYITNTLPYEKDVSDFIMKRFKEDGFITEYAPIVAKGPNSANPHYEPKGRGDKIQKGDFVLIDLRCKKNIPGSIYGDITRVFMLGEPTLKMKEAFQAVRGAQKIGIQHVKIGATGASVDTAAREHLENKGYGQYILHRLGHSIDTNLHGSGANFDSFETLDARKIIPNTCYSVEPALYFPGEFGLRLECDVLVTAEGVQVTGGTQEEIICL